MDGKEIVREWFGLEKPPHAEYLELADMIDSALAHAREEEREACENIAMNILNHTAHPPIYNQRPSYEFGRQEAAGEIAITIRSRSRHE